MKPAYILHCCSTTGWLHEYTVVQRFVIKLTVSLLVTYFLRIADRFVLTVLTQCWKSIHCLKIIVVSVSQNRLSERVRVCHFEVKKLCRLLWRSQNSLLYNSLVDSRQCLDRLLKVLFYQTMLSLHFTPSHRRAIEVLAFTRKDTK